MAKKGGGAQANQSSNALANLSQQLYSQTNPIRQALIDRSSAFLGVDPSQMSPAFTPMPTTSNLSPRDLFQAIKGGQSPASILGAVQVPQTVSNPVGPQINVAGTLPQGPQGVPQLDVTQSPMYGAIKNAMDTQFKLARDNTIARSAPGGSLTSALANLESQRAGAMVTGIGGLAQDELSRAYGLATGGAQMSTSGLSSAAAIQAQLAAANAQRQGAAKSGLGSGLGYMGGMFFGGPAGAAAGGAAGGQLGSK